MKSRLGFRHPGLCRTCSEAPSESSRPRSRCPAPECWTPPLRSSEAPSKAPPPRPTPLAPTHEEGGRGGRGTTGPGMHRSLVFPGPGGRGASMAERVT